MTGERDFIGQLEAYLHEYEGATPLPNAVRDALHAELPRISQVRRWRLPEYRYLGLAAAVVLLAVVGLYLALAGPPPGNPGPTPTHIASESPTTPVVEGERTELRVGSVYDATAFSEPLRFITPSFDPTVDQGDGVVAVAQPLGSTAGVLMIEYGCCWVTWLLDDQPVRADVCDASVGHSPGHPRHAGRRGRVAPFELHPRWSPIQSRRRWTAEPRSALTSRRRRTAARLGPWTVAYW